MRVPPPSAYYLRALRAAKELFERPKSSKRLEPPNTVQIRKYRGSSRNRGKYFDLFPDNHRGMVSNFGVAVEEFLVPRNFFQINLMNLNHFELKPKKISTVKHPNLTNKIAFY